MDPILSFTRKNKRVHGYFTCRFSIKHKHIVIQVRAIYFLNSDLKYQF